MNKSYAERRLQETSKAHMAPTAHVRWGALTEPH